MDCSMWGSPVLHYLLEFAQNHVHLFDDAIQTSNPLLPPSPPAFNLSQHRGLFQWVSSLASGDQSIGVSASASVLPMSIQGWFPLGLIWFDLAVWGTLKSLLQHHSSKALILRHSAFFMVQLLHPYVTTGKTIAFGKTIALTRWTFVSKVMSLLFNMLSRLVITLLPRSKHLLISWLQSPSAVILEPKKIKSATVSIVSPSICC